MGEELDLRRSLRYVWRHKILVGVFAALGLMAGIGYTVLSPPMLSSTALVVLPPSVHDTRTQVAIATSDPVLASVRRSIDTAMSLEAMRHRVRAGSPAYNLISISAQGTTAAQAERTANAVASSYVHYVSSTGSPGRTIPAHVLSAATSATDTPLPIHVLYTGGVGALAGFLIGAIVALAIGRSDRRLHQRDEIAESIGVPVLASITARPPSDVLGWRRLLEDYKPGPVDAWRLRRVLEDLNLAESNGSGASLAVVSLSSDPKALVLGPQLALVAASIGIPTALIVGPQDANAGATLRVACSGLPSSAGQSGNLRIAVSDNGDVGRLPGAALSVVIVVVDPKEPKVTDRMHTSATMLGVSAGAATAEQLARVAAKVATHGSYIAGVLVANPESDDQTTGRLPHLARPVQRRVTVAVAGIPTETEP